MNSIPLLLFFVVLVVYLWYTFSIVYHLIRFGVGRAPKILALIFLSGSFVLFAAVVLAAQAIQWSMFQQFFYR